jgi:hypothetical protein
MRVKKILENLFKRMDIYTKVKSYEALEVWDRVVGEYISKNTMPKTIINRILYVNVKNSLWMQELILMKNGFINSINKYMGMEVIKDIHFRIGRLNRDKTTKKDIKNIPDLNNDEIIKIERIVSPIKDEEIKDIVKKVMEKEAKAKILYRTPKS